MSLPYDIIRKKRDGHRLSKEEISSFLSSYTAGEVPDYQVSAFLMAAFLRGLDADETRHLTEVMVESGTVLDLSDIPGPKIDKHSTGGVGDKVSLVLVPLIVSAGVVVPMMSGRGLGHTGGTLDKLESIPGFRTTLSASELKDILSQAGGAMVGFSDQMVPLDRKLYALRDVTATVESVPLITGSIMSKKLSEGIDGLVLDVKVGSGAFMKDMAGARHLAKNLVDTGNSFGVRTVAVITDMSVPLGMAVGNALEVLESIDALSGNGPEDLMEITLYLGAMMLRIAGIEPEIPAGIRKLKRHIEDGSALNVFADMIRLQGGNASILERRTLLPHACLTVEVYSPCEGYIRSMDSERVGRASMVLGAGRPKLDSLIDHSAGIVLHKKPGDYVREGDPLCTLCTSDEEVIGQAKELFIGALSFGEDPPEKPGLIREVIE